MALTVRLPFLPSGEGPVVAAACIVPPHVEIAGIDDSKKMTAEAREVAYEQLTTHPDVKWAA